MGVKRQHHRTAALHPTLALPLRRESGPPEGEGMHVSAALSLRAGGNECEPGAVLSRGRECRGGRCPQHEGAHAWYPHCPSRAGGYICGTVPSRALGPAFPALIRLSARLESPPERAARDEADLGESGLGQKHLGAGGLHPSRRRPVPQRRERRVQASCRSEVVLACGRRTPVRRGAGSRQAPGWRGAGARRWADHRSGTSWTAPRSAHIAMVGEELGRPAPRRSCARPRLRRRRSAVQSGCWTSSASKPQNCVCG